MFNPRSNIIKRPLLGKADSICFKCDKRILLPRKSGNLCSACYKEVHAKQTLDKTTADFLKKFPFLPR